MKTYVVGTQKCFEWGASNEYPQLTIFFRNKNTDMIWLKKQDFIYDPFVIR